MVRPELSGLDRDPESPPVRASVRMGHRSGWTLDQRRDRRRRGHLGDWRRLRCARGQRRVRPDLRCARRSARWRSGWPGGGGQRCIRPAAVRRSRRRRRTHAERRRDRLHDRRSDAAGVLRVERRSLVRRDPAARDRTTARPDAAATRQLQLDVAAGHVATPKRADRAIARRRARRGPAADPRRDDAAVRSRGGPRGLPARAVDGAGRARRRVAAAANSTGRALATLVAIVGLVLLVACANIAT